MKTKHLIILLAANFLFVGASITAFAKDKTKVTDASDSRITYIGRVLKEGPNVSFDWSGVQCRLRFNGTGISLRCSDTKANYYNVWIDKETGCAPDLVIRTAGKDTTIVLAEKLGKGIHNLTLLKRTEGEQGKTTFHSFETTGELLQADPVRKRLIEFVGDSYTCGYGTENSVKDDPFKPETENCNLTYAAIASRYFDADCILVCHSGRGIARNYDDWGKGTARTTMPEKYEDVFDEAEGPLCDKPEQTPDLVVVYLGANDFSCGRQPSMELFCQNYHSLLNKIKARYGKETPVLCLAAMQDNGIYVYVREACLRSGLEGVWCVGVHRGIYNEDSDLGASMHPNHVGQKKMAFNIIPYISTITGWEMK